ncbi:MAG: Transcriptional regulator [Thermoleophilia bacterium]|nr:Transcriptional regulator [Thermoleophilia bacterium]
MANDAGLDRPSTIGAMAAPVTATAQMAVALSGLLAQFLRGLTINAHERLALAHLWEHGPMTMSELGARIPLSRAAVTALTDRLEALDYVQRTPDLHDRRRTVLSLNARPEELMAPLVAPWERDMMTLVGTFSAEEQRIIGRWSEGMRDLAHRHASGLRDRSEAELPSPTPT